MKVWGVYDDEIRELVEEVGLRIYNDRWGPTGIRRVGRAYQFRLALGERREDGAYRFQRLSRRGGRIQNVCWHGHREFFFALFRRFPEARVRTGVTWYNGREHFLGSYRETMGLTVNGWEGIHQDSGCVCQPQRIPREVEIGSVIIADPRTGDAPLNLSGNSNSSFYTYDFNTTDNSTQ